MTARPRSTGTHSPTAGRSDYRTQCSRCQKGVYDSQGWTWSRDPQVLGIVHVECEEANHAE